MSWAQILAGVLILLAMVGTLWILLWLRKKDWCVSCEHSRWEPHAYENRLYCYHSAMKGARVSPEDRCDMCPLEFGVEHKEV